jgi:hypothetical protein
MNHINLKVLQINKKLIFFKFRILFFQISL